MVQRESYTTRKLTKMPKRGYSGVFAKMLKSRFYSNAYAEDASIHFRGEASWLDSTGWRVVHDEAGGRTPQTRQKRY